MIELQVIGHLGKDCVVNTVGSKQVINFTVAHSEKYKDSKGEQVEKTTWVECAYWHDSQALPNYLKKGQLVFVKGSPEVKTYAKNDGTTGSSLTLRVGVVELLGSKGENGGSGTGQNANQNQGQSTGAKTVQKGGFSNKTANPATVNSDDLPF